MNKIINIFKKQKLFIFLALILVILLFIKFSLTPPQPKSETSSSPSPLPSSQIIKPNLPIVSPPASSSPSPFSNSYYDPVTEALQPVLEEKPWLLDLPITNQNYSIDYLDEEKGFRVLMKIDITSSLSRQEQIDQIKKEAPEKLEQIGVDLSKEKIYYTFTP